MLEKPFLILLGCISSLSLCHSVSVGVFATHALCVMCLLENRTIIFVSMLEQNVNRVIKIKYQPGRRSKIDKIIFEGIFE